MIEWVIAVIVGLFAFAGVTFVGVLAAWLIWLGGMDPEDDGPDDDEAMA